MIILIVLIGILALLSFYTVVICTGLLVYHVSAGWQETLQVVSALCILWFFLFVIIVGLLVVFWICIQRKSTRKQGTVLVSVGSGVQTSTVLTDF